jgi:hypothetical protein
MRKDIVEGKDGYTILSLPMNRVTPAALPDGESARVPGVVHIDDSNDESLQASIEFGPPSYVSMEFDSSTDGRG